VKHYAFSKRAKQDFQGIIRYTAETWGKNQARTYSEAIITTCEGLTDGKVISRNIDDIRKDLRKAKSGSHFIYFEDREDEVYVIRILHQAMDTGRHLG
jgi:toxin ParE1/3/4